jgi:hypothetical protein
MFSTLTVQETSGLTMTGWLSFRSLRSLQQANRTPTTFGILESFPRCSVPQFIARDFKEFIRLSGMTHVRTSPFYPQSNGKIERWHQSLKAECLRPGAPLSLEDALRLVNRYVEHYNTIRLHSALGYVTPQAMLEGRQQEIWNERDRKLEVARLERQCRRQVLRFPCVKSEVPGTRPTPEVTMTEIEWVNTHYEKTAALHSR